MPFKSAKLSWVKCILKNFIFGLTFLFFASIANATVSIYSVDPYEFDESDVLHFAVNTGASPPNVDSAEGFALFDVNISFTDTDPDSGQMFLLDLESNADFDDPASGQKLVVSVFAEEDGSDGDKFTIVPIAAAENFSNCGDEDADVTCKPKFCVDQDNCQGDTAGLFYAARYTEGEKLRLGFYLKDICDRGGLQGCDSSNMPSTSSSESLELRFAFAIVGSTTHINEADIEAGNISETGDIDISVVATAPTYSCDDLSAFYTPGDGRIFINTDSGIDYKTSTNYPEIDKVIVVADQGLDPDTTGVFGETSVNDVVGRVDISDTDQTVSGFTNSTDTNVIQYRLAIGVRDFSGAVNFLYDSSVPSILPSATITEADGKTYCAMQPIEVSEINGFLEENGCFMATATFQVRDNPQLSLLRDFRDHFLKKFWVGQKTIDFYYSWSPKASRWLVKNSWLRPVVLALLIPIQLFAYFALHPVFFLMTLLSFIGVALVLRQLRRRWV